MGSDLENLSKVIARASTFGGRLPDPKATALELIPYVEAMKSLVKNSSDLEYAKSFSYTDACAAGLPDPRRFFLSRMLQELEAALVSMTLWMQHFEDDSFSKDSTVEVRGLIRAMSKEQALICRTLFEACLFCLNFRQTNSLEFYEHFLLLRELEQHHFIAQDEREFFGQAGQFEQKTIQSHIGAIQALEQSHPILQSAWYRHQNANLQDASKLFVSIRSLYKASHLRFSSYENMVFGFTYSTTYSSSSKLVHFNPVLARSTGEDDLVDVSGGIARCLGYVRLALQAYSNLSPQSAPVFEEFAKTLPAQEKQAEDVVRKVMKEYEVGDIVRILFSIAEVVGVQSSLYGYQRYSVRYLADKTPHLDENLIGSYLDPWILKKQRSDFFNAYPELEQQLASRSEPEVDEFWRQAACAIWENTKAATRNHTVIESDSSESPN